MRQAQGVLQVSRAVLLCFLLPQDLRGNKRLILRRNEDMNISYEELAELLRKATLLDTVINYLKAKGIYATANDILAIVGEPIDEKEESKNVLNF